MICPLTVHKLFDFILQSIAVLVYYDLLDFSLLTFLVAGNNYVERQKQI